MLPVSIQQLAFIMNEESSRGITRGEQAFSRFAINWTHRFKCPRLATNFRWPTSAEVSSVSIKLAGSKLENVKVEKILNSHECSPIIKQIFIYILITSSVFVFASGSTTNFYLPEGRQGQFNTQEAQISATSGTGRSSRGGGSDISQKTINQFQDRNDGEGASRRVLIGAPSLSEASVLIQPSTSRRQQLLIGQQLSNLSAASLPYSLFQEPDPDYVDPIEDSNLNSYPVNLVESTQLARGQVDQSSSSISSPNLNSFNWPLERHSHLPQLQPPPLLQIKTSDNNKPDDDDNDNDEHSGSNSYSKQPAAITSHVSPVPSEAAAAAAASLLALTAPTKRLEAGTSGGSFALEETADGIVDIGAKLSRALLPLDSNNRLRLPQMQQIKARFNQGCVGGTKCQFFAFCWMSGGSLGASCGLLMTCCVTPSRQEIQPGFYGPVVNDPNCGRSTSKINRIVGGTDASFGQFPWQAFVQVGGSRCGGALISSRHVVTAGHCVARSQHSPSSIKVTLGDYILNSDIESIPHEVFSVVEVLLHPNFRFTPQADRYDVAVLELDRQAIYKDNIKPICLPQKDAAFVGRVAYVAGWGALQAGSKMRPKVLQHVAVPVIENPVCEGWHRRKGIDIRIYDEMMCAGYELGQRDACQGDSGGPLMLNQFGVWYLVGIVSAGYSCAKQYQPGIYHRVSSSSDWISSNVYPHQPAN